MYATRISFILLFGGLFIALSNGKLSAQDGYSSASFAISKQRAANRQMPRPEEVQVEEYLNYHRHNIRRPSGEEAVAVDLQWSRPAIQDGNQSILQVGLSTKSLSSSSWRPRLNISLVIDRSGSMSGDKMTKTKEALKAFARQLGPNDLVSLVLFDHIAEVMLHSEPVGNGSSLIGAINRIEARGSTDLNAGIVLGYQEVLTKFDPAYTNRVIILTDALTNTGELDPRAMIRNTQYYDQDRQVDYMLIGIGQDFNLDLSRNLTEGEGLTLHFINDAADIQKVFVDEVESILAPVAKNAFLEIRYPADAGVVNLYGYHPEQSLGLIRVPLNNMNCGLTQVFLLGFPEEFRTKGGEVEISLTYFDLNQQRNIHVIYATAFPSYPMNREEVFKNHSIAFMAQTMKTMATYYANGKYQDATFRLEKAIKQVHDAFPNGLDPDQERVLNILEAYRKDLVVFSEKG